MKGGAIMQEKKHTFWDLFTMVENGKLKSTFMLYSFALALLFLAVYAAAFVLLVDAVHAFMSPVSPWLSGVMECLTPAFVSAVAAFLCQKLARDKRLAATAYVWLTVALIAIAVILLTSFPLEDWGRLINLILQMGVVPIALGSLLTMPEAIKHLRKQQAMKIGG